MTLFQALDSLVLHCFSRLTSPSRGALAEMRRWPSLLRRTKVIYHTMESAETSAVRPRTGGPVVSIVARLQAVKGHRVFLESAQKVLATRPDARFQIVGDGELRDDLMEYAARLGIRESVFFLGYREDILAVIAESDIVACSSFYEALPRCLLEALSVGRPVVATDCGGIPEIIRDEETGLLVPPGDPESLANSILRLMNDPALADRLGQEGRRLVREHFTLEAQCDSLAALYREALGCK